jgi:pyridoxal phosphate enzyme (YggS family)
VEDGIVTTWSVAGERYLRLVDRVRELAGDRVDVVVVSKTFPVEAVIAVREVGGSRFGENYAKEAIDKVEELRQRGIDGCEWHFIGALQSNKVRSLAAVIDVWQTVDRASIVDEIARRHPGARVLLQVNSTGESTKNGCAPADVESLAVSATERGLRVEGLMTMGPTEPDREITRRAFAETARLARALGLSTLSMGMSGDWEIAASEGSTLIRVGSAIFGDRPPLGP